MSLKNRIVSMYQWYRALRSLQRIMATMTLLLVLLGACDGENDPTGLDPRSKVTFINGTDTLTLTQWN